jgi:putative hydroxymethylpyrimidine transport system permease protein
MTGWRAGIAATCLVLVLWQTVIWTTGVARFILPPPALVAQTIWDSRALLAEHAGITMAEVLIGLVLGAALGFVSAIGLVASPTVRALVRPILVFSQAVPVFALAPILTLWLGFGLLSKITMTIIIIYFPVTSSFFDSLMRTNRDWIGLAKVMGASPTRIMWHIRVPAALPGFASGLRLAAVYAPIAAIIGEWVGASKGLGYLMLLANGRAKTDLMFAALIVLAVLTILLHAAVNKLCEKTLDRPEVS